MKKVKRSELFVVRAKGAVTNEWLYGNVIFVGKNGYILSVPPRKRSSAVMSSLDKYLIKIDTHTLDRNIGEYDMNGKMIFENDIIAEKRLASDPGDSEYAYYLIKWYAEYDQFMAVGIDNGVLIEHPTCDRDLMPAIRYSEYYVAGNIHDNSIADFGV